MKKRVFFAALVAASLFASAHSAAAACNSVCRSKCEARPGDFTVRGCISFFAYANGHYSGTQVRGIVNGTFWNRDLCRQKCRVVWQNSGYASARLCELAIPCSSYD